MYYMYLKKERLESKMKKYIKAKELLESNANKKEKKPIYATRKLSIGLVSCMLGLVMATPVVNAEEANLNHPQQVQEENQPADNGVEDPDTNHAPVPLENDETSQEGPHKLETQDADVFEMSPEIMLNAVTKIDVKDPTVNPILYDDTAISGGSLAKYRDKVKKETIIATVHVTLRGKDGTVKANLSVTPTTGTTWKVDLPEGKKVEEGDTVTVYQQIGEDKSQEVTKTAQPSKASSVTLTMPTGEFWIEQYVANIVNADEKAEAIDLLKKANPDIAKDIKSVEFKITGVDPKVASYTVTYKDNSTTEEIPAPGLTVKKVTETSRSPEIDSITIVDNVIKGKLAGPGPFNGIKVQLIVNVNKDKAGQFCNENKCTFDKTSSTPVDVTVQDDGTFSYTLQAWDSLTLDQIVGVSVKEPHKFVSCSTTTVKPVTPEKTEVKDPRKLTGKDKEAIDAAIRKAYTLDGVSKLPNGTGDRDGTPAVIQFDDSGNAKIFDGNDVAGTWDPNDGYKFKPEKNGDGSYKLKDGAQPKITIPAKDLVKNIKPDAPAVALSEDKKSITITPKKVDTDAKIITVSYKDKDGKDQTTTATKDDNGAWSISEGEGSVDQNGVVSLPKNKVKGETDVTAKVTDKGGIADDDTTPLTSEPGTLPVKETKADKVKALGGLDPVAIKKWVGDDVDWKKGVKAKDDAKKSEVEELLKDAKFEDVTEEKRSTSKEGDFKGKIKITFDDKSELVVEKQMLYVSNLVTSGKRENTPDDALVVEFKLGEGTKVDNTGSGAIEGNKDNPVSYQKYKVKPNTDLKTYKNQTLNETYYNLINTKVKAIDKYTEPVWNGENGSVTENFVITETNKVFTAKATKTCDITFDANKGGGSKDKVTQKVNTEYELPAANTFTAPENKQFSGWQIGEDSTLKQPGAKIKITGDTIVKAIWKPIELKVKFQTEAGASGTMEDKTVNKGSKYELPTPTFKPEEGKEFAGWKVGEGTELKAVGSEIDITGNVTLTAVWKDKKEEVKVSFKHGDGATGTMGDKIVNKGSKYELPKPEFTPEEGKEFAGWKVGDGTELKQVGAEIDISGDVTLTAVWKDKKEEVKVSFKHGDGATGTMGDKIVNKGSKYELPTPTFTPEEGKKFAGWKVGDSTELKQAKEKIDISGDVTLTAVWEDKPSNPGGNSGGYTPGGGGSIFTPSKPDKKPEDKKPGDEKPVDPNKPGEEKPNTPSEKNPEKPGEKEPGKEKDKNEEGKKPGVEDRLRIRYNPNGGHWNDNSTDIITYYYDRGNIITLINPPTREGYRFLYWKGSAYQPGDKYTVVDDHMFVAQWEKIGTKASRSNPKTGIESVAGVVCTLIASTGALYIGRKKED